MLNALFKQVILMPSRTRVFCPCVTDTLVKIAIRRYAGYVNWGQRKPRVKPATNNFIWIFHQSSRLNSKILSREYSKAALALLYAPLTRMTKLNFQSNSHIRTNMAKRHPRNGLPMRIQITLIRNNWQAGSTTISETPKHSVSNCISNSKTAASMGAGGRFCSFVPGQKKYKSGFHPFQTFCSGRNEEFFLPL